MVVEINQQREVILGYISCAFLKQLVVVINKLHFREKAFLFLVLETGGKKRKIIATDSFRSTAW